jgi:hypothetical protein
MNIINKSVNKINDSSNIFNYINLNLNNENVNIIHLNEETLNYIYKNTYYDVFNENKINIFIVDVVNRYTISYLKMADYIVYYNKYQKLIIDSTLQLNIPSIVLPLPSLPVSLNNKKENSILFLGDITEDLIDDVILAIDTWQNGESDDVIVKLNSNSSSVITDDEKVSLSKLEIKYYFNCDSFDTSSRLYESLRKYDINGMLTINNSWSNLLDNMLCESKYAYIINKEISSDKIVETIENNPDQIFYSDVKENFLLPLSLSYKCEVIIAKSASTYNSYFRLSYIEFISEISNIANTSSKQITSKPITTLDHDTYELYYNDSNLSNKYIFVINFRNQVDKIYRCLLSIATICRNKPYDVGILITDDMSTDDSLTKIDEFINIYSNKFDIKVIKNNVRKMSSQNLYNAGHYFIDNDDSIMIELDGDDFLNIDYDLIKILDDEYSKGSLKTMGEFQSYPDENIPIVTNNQKYDLSNPWDHGKCTSWAPLRTYKRSLFIKVEPIYFFELNSSNWLKIADDSSINPRMIELANGKVSIIKLPLYIYDLTGYRDSDEDYWSPYYSHTKLPHVITF